MSFAVRSFMAANGGKIRDSRIKVRISCQVPGANKYSRFQPLFGCPGIILLLSGGGRWPAASILLALTLVSLHRGTCIVFLPTYFQVSA